MMSRIAFLISCFACFSVYSDIALSKCLETEIILIKSDLIKYEDSVDAGKVGGVANICIGGALNNLDDPVNRALIQLAQSLVKIYQTREWEYYWPGLEESGRILGISFNYDEFEMFAAKGQASEYLNRGISILKKLSKDRENEATVQLIFKYNGNAQFGTAFLSLSQINAIVDYLAKGEEWSEIARKENLSVSKEIGSIRYHVADSFQVADSILQLIFVSQNKRAGVVIIINPARIEGVDSELANEGKELRIYVSDAYISRFSDELKGIVSSAEQLSSNHARKLLEEKKAQDLLK